MSVKTIHRILAVIFLLIMLITVSGCDGESHVSVELITPTVSLEATKVSIFVGDHTFSPDVEGMQVRSDPGDSISTSLEAEWYQHDVRMRLHMNFQADSYEWWCREIRTYDGSEQGGWIYYKGDFFRMPLGSAWEGDFELEGTTANGMPAVLTLEGMRLKAFRVYEPGATVEDAFRQKLLNIGRLMLSLYENGSTGSYESIIPRYLSSTAKADCSPSRRSLTPQCFGTGPGPYSASELREMEDYLRSFGTSAIQVEIIEGQSARVTSPVEPYFELLKEPFVLEDNRWRLEPTFPICQTEPAYDDH